MAVPAGGTAVTDALPVTASRVGEGIAGGYPGAGAVTLAAAHPSEKTGVVGGIGVAGGTCRWKTGIDATSVALCASQPGMSAGERERGEVMVERGRQPGGSGVTGGTGSPVAAVVLVIARMAGVTIGGGALVDAADMAGGAGHTDMRASQLKGRQVMVE